MSLATTPDVMVRRRLARLLDASGVVELLLRVGSPGSGWVPALNYHRIHPDPESQPFDRGVIDATPEELDQQMAMLVRYFTPITVNELADHANQGKRLPERPALVTFDDGYCECLTRALPILLAHRVRASFFVPTTMVGERRAFWWDRLSFVVRSARVSRLSIRYPVPLQLDLSPGAEAAVRRLLAVFKQSYDLDVERFLNEVNEAAGVPWNREIERRIADELVLDWEGVRALVRAGMEVHSHTRTHRILQNLRREEVDAELAGSRHDIQEALGEAPRAISYPVGHPIVGRPWLVDSVRAAGYELGFSVGVGGDSGRAHPFDVGRISLDVGTQLGEFRAMLVHPALMVA